MGTALIERGHYFESAELKKPSLAFEVDRIKRKGPLEEEMHLLPGTGFNVPLQINLLQKNIREGLKEGENFNSAIDGSFQQLEQDVQGYVVEYLQERPLFPIVLGRESVDGKEMLVGKFYNKKPFSEVVSDKERNGEVKRSINKIEQFLLSNSPGSMAIMTSPPGWSGLCQSDGRTIAFPDTQTYIFQVQQDGEPKGFTMKTDMKIFQNEELLKKLGINQIVKEGYSKEERIINVVRNVAFIENSEGKEIKDIIDIIREVKGSEVAFIDTKGRKRYFEEAYQDLGNPEKLWTLDETTKKYVNEFKDYFKYLFKNGIDDKKRNLEIALGVTILKLANYIRGPKKEVQSKVIYHSYYQEDYLLPAFNHEEALKEMQSIPGCNGGGSSSSSTFKDAITPRNAVTGEILEDEYGSLEFDCPHADCGKTNKRKPHELLENCQHCGKSVRCDDKEKGKIINLPQKQKDVRSKREEKKAA